MNLETIYLKSPISLQTILVNLQGWNIQRRRYNNTYLRVFKDVEKRLDSTISSPVIQHIPTNVPFPEPAD